jgi:hypothetical protein
MRVTPGKIIGFDGRQVRVPAGMMYMTNGSFAPLSAAQAAAQAAATPVVPASLNDTSAQTPSPAIVAVSQNSQPVVQPVVPTVGVTSRGLSQPVTNLIYPAEVNPPAGPATQVTAQPQTSPATIPPPQPAFAAPFRPDRTGPRMDVERPVDRTRPESVPNTRTDVTRVGRDEQRPMDRTRPARMTTSIATARCQDPMISSLATAPSRALMTSGRPTPHGAPGRLPRSKRASGSLVFHRDFGADDVAGGAPAPAGKGARAPQCPSLCDGSSDGELRGRSYESPFHSDCDCV